MLKKLKKIKENKTLRLIWNIIYTLAFIIVVFMLLIVIMQRISGNDMAIGGIRIFTVVTGSMEPIYEVGDVLIAKEVEPEEIKVGDDIVYKGEKGSFKNRIITHRVISIEKQEDGNYEIITKGTANTEQDPEINQTQVYGKIIYKLHLLSILGKMIKNVYVFYFMIIVPVAIIVYKRIKNFRDDDEDEDEEEDNDAKKMKNEEENDGEDSKNT